MRMNHNEPEMPAEEQFVFCADCDRRHLGQFTAIIARSCDAKDI